MQRLRYKRLEIRYAVFFLFVLTLSGCAGKDAEGARYRHASRLGTLSGKGMVIYAIGPEEFPQGGSFVAIQDALPSSEGAQMLRDQVLTDVTIAKTVNDLGLPAAIGLVSSGAGQAQRFAMFYKTPRRSLVLQRSSMSAQWLSLSQLYESRIVADLPNVPQSVRRLAFHEDLPASPWPVTIPPDVRDAFAVPAEPAAPVSAVDGHDYVAVADDLMARLLPTVTVENRQRAEAMLAKLEPVAEVEGLHWRMMVISGEGAMGFGVPDGTLIVSDGLVQALDDAELTAVIAHLMGHERYQHARAAARRRDILSVLTLVGGSLSLAGGAMGSFLIPTGGYLALIASPQFGYTQTEEVEANAAAALMLSKTNQAPGELFEAMVKLSGRGQEGTLAFDTLHHLSDSTILQYGLMLDAGLSGKQP